MGSPVTIAVFDDHDVVLAGVARWVADDPQHRVRIVHAARELSELSELESSPAATADVLVIDLRMHERYVFAEIADLVAAGRRVVVFSQHAEPELVQRAELAGAGAFIAKETDEGRRHLIEAVLAVAAGGTYTTPSQAGAMLAASGPDAPTFSAQELRAMRLWLGGLTRAAVARQMGISEHTVKQYLERAREKYAKAGRDARTRLDLYRQAQRDGLLPE
jgi:DNA-binding NarL/FixJ family response regulator